jgi:monofunctional biosynthetic peptidoglycan transglycosylase
MSPSRLVLTSLLGLLGLAAMNTLPTADADEPPAEPRHTGPKRAAEKVTRTLTDFTAATPDLRWYVVNDGVMGGKSQGGFESADTALDFRGTTNTDGGGFSSIRTRPLELDLSGFDGIRLRVRGDGRRYTWRLTTDARWRGRQVSFWADFETEKDEWVVADIPWKRFKPQWRGRKLSGLPLDPGEIRGMGLMMYDKKDGPFALRLDRVEAYRRPFSLRDHRWKSRVLVVYAPDADDEHLAKQRADVARTRAAFRERDMLLVVVLGDGEAFAGERRLTPDEALAVLRATDIEPKAFALRLVGKDGGVKRTETGHTAMKSIYEQIDSMPMRRAEMGR